MTILELQDQVRRLTNQIAQVKEAMREPPCLKVVWIQITT